jgi:hypothetical protein
VGSFWEELRVDRGIEHYGYWAALECGQVTFGSDNFSRSGEEWNNRRFWTIYHGAANREASQFFYRQTQCHFMGFGYDPLIRIPGWGEHRHLLLPLWFPTALSALLLWFVWCKTRRNPAAKGFPVEAVES